MHNAQMTRGSLKISGDFNLTHHHRHNQDMIGSLILRQYGTSVPSKILEAETFSFRGLIQNPEINLRVVRTRSSWKILDVL